MPNRMDENAQPQSNSLPKPAGSGLRLVIPSLKSLKAAQTSTPKTKHRAGSLSHSSSVFQDVDNQEKKPPPRPVKLKPLKEVLTKLIGQIKKKDDYAFFLTPVKPASVPGYSDVIKCPMDFGTMTDKVNRGKYRSLDEFAADFKLVTTNAKIFNPPGSIYHVEADRIEAWGIDHISKASSTVIQFETDWNIDVEKDDEEQPVNVDQDEDDNVGTPMDIDGASTRERSVSLAPSQQPQGSTRRGPRGPYKRTQTVPSNALSETLEPDGGLPGSKDGIGAFPPESDWAKTMIALKLKGKRYKTKKERMRVEREGPPLLPDGSLDYTEMEDPFSVLSALVPEPLTRPHLVPIYPPLYQPSPPVSLPASTDPSSSQTPATPHTQLPSQFPLSIQPSVSVTSAPGSGPPAPAASFPSATSLSLDHQPPPLPFLSYASVSSRNASSRSASQSQPQFPSQSHSQSHSQSQFPSVSQPHLRRRHWLINRNASSRQKGKEKEDLADALGQDVPDLPPWQMPREAHALDFGTFTVLSGALAEEMRRRGVSGASVAAAASASVVNVNGMSGGGLEVKDTLDQEVNLDLVRISLDLEAKMKDASGAAEEWVGANGVDLAATSAIANGVGVNQNGVPVELKPTNLLTNGYWTIKRAVEAEEYLKEVVYGGADGFAYARSLAEFVDGDCLYKEETLENESKPGAFGVPLYQWVLSNILDPLTEGRHSLLRETALSLIRLLQQDLKPHILTGDPRKGTVETQVLASLYLYPATLIALSSILSIKMHKIDMGSLLKSPEELFISEEEWAGKGVKERKRRKAMALKKEATVKAEVEAETTTRAQDEDPNAMEVEEPEQTWAGVDAELNRANDVNGIANGSSTGRLGNYELEGPEELNEVLEYVAGVISELDRKIRAGSGVGKAPLSVNGIANGVTDAQEKKENVDEANGISKLPQTTTTTTADQAVDSGLAEDPVLRNLRLNLLALAKRAPLDTIARLPKDLVPEHIRHFVPTLGTSG